MVAIVRIAGSGGLLALAFWLSLVVSDETLVGR